MSSVKPFGRRIAVTKPPADAASGGLYIPPEANVGPSKGIVTAVGEDMDPIEIGMAVYYHRHAQFEIGDTEIISADCIVAFEEA